MWALKFLLGFAFVGFLLADIEQEMDECTQHINFDEMEEDFPESDYMEVLCPAFTNTLKCIDDVITENLGVRFSELADSAIPGSVAHKGANFLRNLQILVQEACTEGSPLNKAIIEHADCMEPIVDEDTCEDEAKVAYKSYKKLEDVVQIQTGNDVTDDDDDECMLKAYEMACMATSIHEKCGQDAYDTFVQIVKRSSLFKYALCSEGSLEELKTNFVDSLDMADSRKDLFRLAFDLRRRK